MVASIVLFELSVVLLDATLKKGKNDPAPKNRAVFLTVFDG
tara:strand:+ start:2106 stop:2228 length:123 start_codon:yes stop_codon:yes gene_type:complete